MMIRSDIVERAKFRPSDMIDTELGLVVWASGVGSMHFRSTEHSNNVVNRIEMRINVTLKLVDGNWRQDYLSCNRVGSFDSVSSAARDKILRVLIAQANRIYTPLVAAHTKANAAYEALNRKLGEINECEDKLIELREQEVNLKAELNKAINSFDEVLS